MHKWEYKVFASHLDPAELVIILDESGAAGWELVTLVAVVDDLPAVFVARHQQAMSCDCFDLFGDSGQDVVGFIA